MANHSKPPPEGEVTVEETSDGDASAFHADHHSAETPQPGPQTLGRYVLAEVLGEGAMGRVYRAYDPELDRRVALKVLRVDSGNGRKRLLREARAMARLQDPHVATVYDAGISGADVFVAMELVAGSTLERWLAAEPRTQAAILRVFVEAGRGLAAAHAAGIVHRDFKPSNVMVDSRGRARVLDFGIAWAPVQLTSNEVDTAPDGHSLDQFDAQRRALLTRTGSLMGTPAYMAPEQFGGSGVDPRADQFSFCVALFEALYGVRPFPGKTVRALYESLQQRVLREPAEPSRPAWLRAAVLRGLAHDPADRYGSMDALVAALEADPALARRRQLTGLGLVALLVGAVAVGTQVRSPQSSDPCADVATSMAERWSPQTAARVRAAFAGTGKGYASDVAENVVNRVDRYAKQWRRARVDTCQATLVHRTQSNEAFDLRMRCLERGAERVGALVSLFTGDVAVSTMEQAVTAAAQLPPLSRCDDIDALRAVVPLPEEPARRARIGELHRVLDRVESLHDTGQLRPAVEAARATVAQATAVAHAPLLARAELSLGVLQSKTGSAREAEVTLHRAARQAAAARDHRRLNEAWIQLVYVIGSHLARHDEALSLRPFVGSALRLAGGGAELEAKLHDHVGSVLLQQGKYPEAAEHQRQALRLHEDRGAAVDIARSLTNLGLTLVNAGEYGEARGLLDRGIDLMKATLGPGHPHRATALNNLGLALHSLGELEGAQARYSEALAIGIAAQGPEHPDVGGSYNNLGEILVARGELDEAEKNYQRAFAIWNKALGAAHPVVMIARVNLGGVALKRGRWREAVAHCTAALTIGENALGKEHPNVAYPLHCLGEAQLGLEDRSRAVSHLERALTIRIAQPGDPAALAETQLVLARALGRGKRGRALAQTALRAFEGMGDAGRDGARRTRAWLGP